MKENKIQKKSDFDNGDFDQGMLVCKSLLNKLL